MAALTLDLIKHSGPTPADDMAPQIITDCGNFTLDFKQLGFGASPLFLQTLGPWFPNEMQNFHWATVQLFFSFAQVRRFWRCLWFRSGLTLGIDTCSSFLDTSVRDGSWCTDSILCPLLVKLPQVLESALLDSSQGCGHPCSLCTFSYHTFPFENNTRPTSYPRNCSFLLYNHHELP